MRFIEVKIGKKYNAYINHNLEEVEIVLKSILKANVRDKYGECHWISYSDIKEEK